MDNQNNSPEIQPTLQNSPGQPVSPLQGMLKQPFMKNNSLVLVIVFTVVLLIVVLAIIFMNANAPKPVKATPSNYNTTNTTTGISNTPSTPVSNTVSLIPSGSPQAQVIEQQVKPQIEKVISPGTSFEFTAIKQYSDTWATANIFNPNVGGGLAILQKVNGSWTVAYGPTSYFTEQQLSSLNIPQQMENAILNPSGTPSNTPSNSPQISQ